MPLMLMEPHIYKHGASSIFIAIVNNSYKVVKLLIDTACAKSQLFEKEFSA